MNKHQIAQEITKHHHNFINKINQLSDEEFLLNPASKWSAGQQVEHIIKSVQPVKMAFSLPKFLLKYKFGVANRPSKTYEALVQKYLGKVAEDKDYEPPSKYTPKIIALNQKDAKFKQLQSVVHGLGKKVLKLSEEDLDKYILPHPAIGKLTLREMLYFTIYHVQHHDKQILENLSLEKH